MYEFMRRLRAMAGMSARCLEFVVLTACRCGAARFATWDEIDWKNQVWNIPAKPGRKMKLLKIGATIVRNTRRVQVLLASRHPLQHVFIGAAQALAP